MGTHLLASLGSKGKHRNSLHLESLACLRNAGFHSAESYCNPRARAAATPDCCLGLGSLLIKSLPHTSGWQQPITAVVCCTRRSASPSHCTCFPSGVHSPCAPLRCYCRITSLARPAGRGSEQRLPVQELQNAILAKQMLEDLVPLLPREAPPGDLDRQGTLDMVAGLRALGQDRGIAVRKLAL
jgi:hypothetical protein